MWSVVLSLEEEASAVRFRADKVTSVKTSVRPKRERDGSLLVHEILNETALNKHLSVPGRGFI